MPASMPGSRAPRTILITRDDGWASEVDANLIEAATVEVLRACACGADIVLIPATLGMLPLAAVIANDLRQMPFEVRDESPGREAQSFSPGRFIPIEWNTARGDPEFLRAFLRTDLGGSMVDPIAGHSILPVDTALARYPPSVVVALTGDNATLELLRTYELKPRVCYFRSLLGRSAVYFAERLPNRLIDLEEQMPRLDERDEESGRSDDEGLEPFIPFGVLLQFALGPPEPQQ